MPDTCLSYVLHGSQDIRREACVIPPLTDGMVRIQMKQMGICGTDVGYFKRGPVGRYGNVGPFILGHEGTGEIVDASANVDRALIGKRVAIDPSQPCRDCRYCLSGRYNLCRDMHYLGSAANNPPDHGLFSEFLVFPARNCHALPDRVSVGEAAMIEPLSVAMHAVKRAGDIAGDSVLITGGGPIGQLVLLVTQAFGASKIALSEMVESRRAFALNSGADWVLDPTDDTVIAQATDFTNGGFDVVFEAAGSSAALSQAFEMVRPGGTVVQIGGISADSLWPANRVMPKELQYLGSLRFANIFQTAIDQIAAGHIDVKPLISRVLPFDDFEKAMRLAQGKDGVVKVQIAIPH